MSEATGYFVRKATGLVRAWSAFDAFIYAFFSVNFVTLGMYIMSFGPFVPQGHLLPAAIITGIFVTFLVVVAFVAYYIAIGMERYAKIQKFCFWGGIVALGIVLLLLLVGTQGQFQQAFNREAARLFGASGDAYTQTIEASRKYGFTPPPFTAMPLGPSILLIPMVVFYLLWPNWGATLYGEVRGASDYRRVFKGMFWGLWITVALSVLFFLLVAKTMGWE